MATIHCFYMSLPIESDITGQVVVNETCETVAIATFLTLVRKLDQN